LKKKLSLAFYLHIKGQATVTGVIHILTIAANYKTLTESF